MSTFFLNCEWIKRNVMLMSLITTKLLSLVFLTKFSFGYYDRRNFILLKEKSKGHSSIRQHVFNPEMHMIWFNFLNYTVGIICMLLLSQR